MEAVCVYQPVSDSRQYYYRYKDLKEDMGTDYTTLLCFRKDKHGWPCVWEAPLAVGGFYRKEAPEQDRKALLSRALTEFREEQDPDFVSEAEQYRRELWQSIWDEFTPCPRSLITM
jgi:hypothetical protein